jgi:hypothetical protein
MRLEFGNCPVYHVTLLRGGVIMGEVTVTTAYSESEAVEKAKRNFGYIEALDFKIIRL